MLYSLKYAFNSVVLVSIMLTFGIATGHTWNNWLLAAFGIVCFLLYQVDACVDGEISDTTDKYAKRWKSLKQAGIYIFFMDLILLEAAWLCFYWACLGSDQKFILGIVACLCALYFILLTIYSDLGKIKNILSASVLAASLPIIFGLSDSLVAYGYGYLAALFFVNFNWLDSIYGEFTFVQHKFFTFGLLLLTVGIAVFSNYTLMIAFAPALGYYLVSDCYDSGPQIKEWIGDALLLLPFLGAALNATYFF